MQFQLENGSRRLSINPSRILRVHTSQTTIFLSSGPWAIFSSHIETLLTSSVNAEVHLNLQLYPPQLIEKFHQFLTDGRIPISEESASEASHSFVIMSREVDDFLQLVHDLGGLLVQKSSRDKVRVIRPPLTTRPAAVRAVLASACHVCLSTESMVSNSIIALSITLRMSPNFDHYYIEMDIQ